MKNCIFVMAASFPIQFSQTFEALKPLPSIPRTQPQINRRNFGISLTGLISALTSSTNPSLGKSQPKKALKICLVNAINAREGASLLERDLRKNRRIEVCREVVKQIVVGLDLKRNLTEGSYYLRDENASSAAREFARDAVEYLASVVEFDAFDKLQKSYTSNAAQSTMNDEKLEFIINALDAAVGKMDGYISLFPKESVDEAKELYLKYYLPVEVQLERQNMSSG
mmetsp:Transcript_15378/g.22843  ORF Transcript_15378/g.22843 Transcript_15378/m.22843 type:complete len:226 (+) Transcript_15378:39-716(+)